jgi:hypothetical protein
VCCEREREVCDYALSLKEEEGGEGEGEGDLKFGNNFDRRFQRERPPVKNSN